MCPKETSFQLQYSNTSFRYLLICKLEIIKFFKLRIGKITAESRFVDFCVLLRCFLVEFRFFPSPSKEKEHTPPRLLHNGKRKNKNLWGCYSMPKKGAESFCTGIPKSMPNKTTNHQKKRTINM